MTKKYGEPERKTPPPVEPGKRLHRRDWEKPSGEFPCDGAITRWVLFDWLDLDDQALYRAAPHKYASRMMRVAGTDEIRHHVCVNAQCSMRQGHPGHCIEVLPSAMFDRDGWLKPHLQRAFDRANDPEPEEPLVDISETIKRLERRKNHGTVEATPDDRSTHSGSA